MLRSGESQTAQNEAVYTPLTRPLATGLALAKVSCGVLLAKRRAWALDIA
ncbi:hypothetical protein XM38_016550 [Halomicronema hongdechloris C2206]|uniref:Uncharacterized protein n=1 Tax=Halomicronema hongdechloris C2206 TaxID=1641165 RepID=A0A1Z3HK77_9CYAN|nr:hypothetical protein [Halomicronema hongdechloris]ASC70710.1 hypothetical protein XM38_016550 [Halomicronema hongdechloris C2206]